MAVAARLESLANHRDRRARDRYLLKLEAAGTMPQPRGAAVIHNISQGGMLVESSADLAVGSRLRVCVDEATITEATVVWNRDNYFGCEFEAPISNANLAKILLKNDAGRPWSYGEEELELAPPSRSARLWVIFILSVAAWGIVILIAWLI